MPDRRGPRAVEAADQLTKQETRRGGPRAVRGHGAHRAGLRGSRTVRGAQQDRRPTAREHEDQDEAGHPPGAAGPTGRGREGQPGRTAPTYGIEFRPVTWMPTPGFSAFTIMPLPMYMPTWLIGL